MRLPLDMGTRCVYDQFMNVNPNGRNEMYTAESATASHIRYEHAPDHEDASALGYVTFVSLSWGANFIATSMPGIVVPAEAFILAACEMNTIWNEQDRLDAEYRTIVEDVPFTDACWLGWNDADADLARQEIR